MDLLSLGMMRMAIESLKAESGPQVRDKRDEVTLGPTANFKLCIQVDLVF